MNLRFFINAEHDGTLRWIQIKSDNVTYFFDEESITEKLERLGSVGLQPKKPQAFAMERLLQCVASFGIDSARFVLQEGLAPKFYRHVLGKKEAVDIAFATPLSCKHIACSAQRDRKNTNHRN